MRMYNKLSLKKKCIDPISKMAPKRARQSTEDEGRRERGTTSSNPAGIEEINHPSQAINIIPDQVPAFIFLFLFKFNICIR